jgi:arylformamidase
MNLAPRVVAVGLIGLVACGPRTASDRGVAADSAVIDASACRGAGAPRSMLDLRYHAIAGVDPNLLSLDLYLPSIAEGCAPPPLVVYVHGGAWSVGDKRSQIATKVAYFAAEGVAFASVNYRLSPSRTMPMGVQYPTHNQDVARAIAWLRERAGMYRYRAERITLFGHSAGAGIATLVGTDPQFLSEHGRTLADLSCVASLDTEAYDISSQIAEGGSSEMIYRNAFGSDSMVWTRASPLLNGTLRASNRLPPFLVVTRGAASRRALSQRFVDAINAAGSMATVHTADPLTHEGVNDAIGERSDTVVMPVFGPFIERCAR